MQLSAPIRHASMIGLVAALVAGLVGCFPVAWVLPPTQIEGGAGVSYAEEPALSVPISVAVFPMQVIPDKFERLLDAGAGYRLEGLFSSRWQHGPFMDLAYHHQVGSEARPQRIALGGRGYYLFSTNKPAEQGPAAAVRVVYEAFWFSSEPFSSCGVDENASSGWHDEDEDDDVSVFCGVGMYYGEQSVGLFLEASHVWATDPSAWALTIGLTMRLPSTFGAGVIFNP